MRIFQEKHLYIQYYNIDFVKFDSILMHYELIVLVECKSRKPPRPSLMIMLLFPPDMAMVGEGTTTMVPQPETQPLLQGDLLLV